MNILIVDDEVDFLELMSTRLLKRGFTVSIASNGKTALEKVKKSCFDAVLLDVKLPGEDGFCILSEMKAFCPDLPIMLLTGYANVESAMKCVELGAADYILKTTPLNDLIAQLRSLEGQKK